MADASVRAAFWQTMDRVESGDNDPRCLDCGAILKLAVVLFGEHLDQAIAGLAERIAANTQLMPAVGTSLRVEPAASLCAVAVNAGSRLVMINRDPTPYDDLAVAVLREPISRILPNICAAIGEITGAGTRTLNGRTQQIAPSARYRHDGALRRAARGSRQVRVLGPVSAVCPVGDETMPCVHRIKR